MRHFSLHEPRPKVILGEICVVFREYYQEKNYFYAVINVLEGRLHINSKTLGSFVKDVKNMSRRTTSDKKTVFITGSNRGIGYGIAKYCDSQGYNIILHARHEFSEKILSQFNNVLDIAIFDITDSKTMSKEIKRILSTNVAIDILINCAGITNDSILVNMTHPDFTNVLNTNFLGTVNIMNQLIPKMVEQRGGSIINISSAIAESGNVGQANYAASKSAIIDFTHIYAHEYASEGIRINAICPGMIVSSMTDKLSEKMKKHALSKIPLKRFGNASEVAQIVMAVALNTYMTGSVVDVNGGLRMGNNS